MSETIKLRATRGLWHAGRVIRAGETFKVDVPGAQTAIGSGRAEPADDVERANLVIGAAKEREALLRRLARP